MEMLETREETLARPRIRPSRSCPGAAMVRVSSPGHARRPARREVELVAATPEATTSLRAVEQPIAEGFASALAPGWGAAPYLSPASSSQVDGLQLYLREAGHSRLLTAEDEVRLAQEIEAGREARAKLESGEATAEEVSDLVAIVERGDAARQQLISANLRLVVSLAKQHLGPDVEFADLIQEGNLGLMRAVDRFDWRKGNRFSTYALWWIRQAVSCAVSEHSRSIRLPSHMIDSISRLSKAEQRLTQELGRYPTDVEVCQALGISIGKLADLRQALDRPCSLETPIGQDGDAELVDMVEDHVAPTPLSAALAASLRDQVERVLATLDPRERTVISLRFGLDDDEPRTLEEVGRALRITKERVRQIESRALRKLRHTTRSRWLVEYAE